MAVLMQKSAAESPTPAQVIPLAFVLDTSLPGVQALLQVVVEVQQALATRLQMCGKAVTDDEECQHAA